MLGGLIFQLKFILTFGGLGFLFIKDLLHDELGQRGLVVSRDLLDPRYVTRLARRLRLRVRQLRVLEQLQLLI